jgi:hypothetical protein
MRSQREESGWCPPAESGLTVPARGTVFRSFTQNCIEPEPDGIEAKFKREKYEVFEYEKRLSKRFMSDQSGSDVFIGDPEAFAEWVGYSVDELLEGAAEQAGEGEDEPEEPGPEEAQSDRAQDNGGGLLSRLLGR